MHRRWAYPRVSYTVTFCVLCWLLFYIGAYPHSWVHEIFCRFSPYSFYFLILMSHHTEAYPISGFIISSVDFMVVRPTCWYFRAFYWVIIPSHWVCYLSHLFSVILGVFGCRPHSLFLVFALGVFICRLHTLLIPLSLFRASSFF